MEGAAVQQILHVHRFVALRTIFVDIIQSRCTGGGGIPRDIVAVLGGDFHHQPDLGVQGHLSFHLGVQLLRRHAGGFEDHGVLVLLRAVVPAKGDQRLGGVVLPDKLTGNGQLLLGLVAFMIAVFRLAVFRYHAFCNLLPIGHGLHGGHGHLGHQLRQVDGVFHIPCIFLAGFVGEDDGHGVGINLFVAAGGVRIFQDRREFDGIGIGAHLHPAGAALRGIFAALVTRHQSLQLLVYLGQQFFADVHGFHGSQVLCRQEICQIGVVGIIFQQLFNAVQNLQGGVCGGPGGGVGSVAHGAGGDGHFLGGFVQIGAHPAQEFVFLTRGRFQGDGGAFDIVAFGVIQPGVIGLLIGDGIVDGCPVGCVGQIAAAPGLHQDLLLDTIQSGARPAGKGITVPGGGRQGEAVFRCIGGGVFVVVGAAAQVIGDGVVHGLPAGVEGGVRPQHIGCHIKGGGGSGVAVPAGEGVVLEGGVRFRRDGHGVAVIAHGGQKHGAGAVGIVGHIGQVENPGPLGVDGQAAGEGEGFQVDLLGLEGRVGIPIHELIAFVVRGHNVQKLLAHPQRGVGKEVVLLVVSSGNGVDAGFVLILGQTLHRAEDHGDVAGPVGVEGQVLQGLFPEDEGLAGAVVGFIPAPEGHGLDGRVLRLDKGLLLGDGFRPVGAQLPVVILVGDGVLPVGPHRHVHICRRHDEADGVLRFVHGEFNGFVLAFHRQVAVALFQGGLHHHLAAEGQTAVFIRYQVGQNQVGDALPGGDGQLPADHLKIQVDIGGEFPAGDRQPGGCLLALGGGDPDGMCAAVQSRAGQGQVIHPVFIPGEGVILLTGGQAQGIALVGIQVHVVADHAVGALETVDIQVVGHVVFGAVRVHVEAHHAVGRGHKAEAADPGGGELNVRHIAVLVSLGPEEQGVFQLGVGFLGQLLDPGQVQGTGDVGVDDAAHHVGFGEAGFVDGSIVPGCRCQAPVPGAPVIEHHAGILGGFGNGAVLFQMEPPDLLLHKGGGGVVFIGQHQVQAHLAAVVFTGDLGIEVDGTGVLALGGVAQGEHAVAGILGTHRLAVDRQVFHGQAEIAGLGKELLLGLAAALHQVPGLHGHRHKAEDGPAVGIGGNARPLGIQLVLVHIGHTAGDRGGPQGPAAGINRPALFNGFDEQVDLQAQVHHHVQANLEMQRAQGGIGPGQ